LGPYNVFTGDCHSQTSLSKFSKHAYQKGGVTGRRLRSGDCSPGRPLRQCAAPLHLVPGRLIHRLLTVDDIYLLTQHRGEDD